ncbi:hypothetical protein D6D17_06002 [Aureobasidium pullulans]|uniref:PDZ GRASP-type domain-containing protein n=1 Tax=Aureobasidium pullulans TaxID=5580 RepID=A0A4S8Y562_AURPU|nr:hypothetical protein D6D29_01701 [Aureobasidium pullulans]THW45625.1 hypothetical protein D6D22_03452 [Aureobasidium pullulans]THX03094.1 hypothetical protein D6D17_06002 [Aureobasidium pullulans]THX27417.1 hypothetical protein D6D12_05523 [Aureobasidium pullulans]THX37571.1 hypothetical protein D6D10_05774 [Aureobasidium pullulans]
MANMFGALNRFISRLDSDPQAQKQGGASDTYGFQVLRNNNPELPLEPWFDSIIGINGRTIDNPEPSLFVQELRNCAGTNISLGVYSAKGQQIREVFISIPADGSPLGLALQWSPLTTTEAVWHILDVIPNSPADVAGLLPYSDYVIGSPEGLMRGDSGLSELIEDFLNRPLRLYVYNNEYDVTRMITITPSRGWGGDGALGCVLGYGALHRVPAPLNEPAQAPGETLFETARFSNEEPRSASTPSGDFLVPANLNLSATTPPASTGVTGEKRGSRKQRVHHAISPTAGLDDYFAEGELKSRELDNAPTPKPTQGLPPPPKAGGPPRSTKSPAVDAASEELEAEVGDA